MDSNTLAEIITELSNQETDGTFYDFKVDYPEPEKIGSYISALSNSALLAGQPYGYLIYGIDDKTHLAVGTKFKPASAKGKGNEDLVPWLTRLLTPHIIFEIYELELHGKRIVVFLIPAAKSQPTSFMKVKYIRLESYVQRLDEYPHMEQKLWNRLEMRIFEMEPAAETLSKTEIANHLNLQSIFSLLKLNFPDSIDGVIDRLIDENILVQTGKSYTLTNLGAILFAHDLGKYPHLSRKKLRIIAYTGPDRLVAKREWELPEGYAVSMVKAMDILDAELPSNEIIRDVVRKDVTMYPRIAIREFLANALIHQNFWISGAGPMVEIFLRRMEITNPGNLLVSIDRLIDCAPRSRNESLARMMRRMGMCEERGSGIDRAINEIELYQLPAPDFKEGGGICPGGYVCAPIFERYGDAG